MHADQIEKYGGVDGIRNINLLSSAVAMPYASFSGNFFHLRWLQHKKITFLVFCRIVTQLFSHRMYIIRDSLDLDR
jgi:hypothetical protein